ncbi:hypothetical protein B0J15DRAFT_396079 [Fusarium solani]|uniref:Uncharacterized protein n=1 Tax=Fusarium solani TaxID=169388 RepID=A0A9P9KMC8_FUSSL|nr:uncharacterized protein B0J15DRAFT_396079 [Fusarium solani]KAH7258734.1 hypothetical protein B0J15DRAFT_396079 [Fusarium solani]
MNDTPLLPPGLEAPDGRSLTSRRAYMAAVFPLYGPYSDEMMAAARAKAERIICFALHGYKKTRVTHSYFEYLVDLTIWDNWSTCISVNKLPFPLPECPWAETGPDPNNRSEDCSSIYAQWLESHIGECAPSAAEQQLEPELASASPPLCRCFGCRATSDLLSTSALSDRSSRCLDGHVWRLPLPRTSLRSI